MLLKKFNGEQTEYSAPALETLEIKVEQGFAATSTDVQGSDFNPGSNDWWNPTSSSESTTSY